MSEESLHTVSNAEISVSSENEVTEKAEEAFNYDDIMKYIGQMGKFQLRSCLLLLIPGFFPGIVVMSYTFTGAIPKYRCLIDECEDRASGVFEPSWLNQTIPWGQENSISQCNRYNRTFALNDQMQCQTSGNFDPNQLERCDEWVYDQSLFKSTIVTDFNLTCDDEWKQTLASTMYMIGMVVGALLLGNIADIIGRRLAFTVNCFVLATAMTASAFSPDLLTFNILRFFCGVAGNAHFLLLYVWGVEAAGKNYRVLVGFMYQVIFSIGSAFLGLIAYYVRDWRTLQLIISVPIFIPVALYWFLPESTRWLIIKKRYDEARHLILQAANMNKKTVPDHLLIIPEKDLEQIKNSNTDQSTIDEESSNKNKGYHSENIFGIFRSSVLRLRIIIMIMAWVAAVMGYYGLTFSATNLSGNFFINYVLSVLIEIPSYFFGIYAMDKLGRRSTVSGSFLLAGMACLTTGLVPEDPAALRIVFSLLGKFFISAAYAGIYSYTAELFPTSARSTSVGLCSTFGKLGAVAAPLIANIGRQVDPALPFIIFAAFDLAIGILGLVLPETNKSPLPSTIREAEELQKFSFRCFQCSKT